MMIFRWLVFFAVYQVVIRGLEFWAGSARRELDKLPSDPHEAAKRILEKAPVIVSTSHLIAQCYG